MNFYFIPFKFFYYFYIVIFKRNKSLNNLFKNLRQCLAAKTPSSKLAWSRYRHRYFPFVRGLSRVFIYHWAPFHYREITSLVIRPFSRYTSLFFSLPPHLLVYLFISLSNSSMVHTEPFPIWKIFIFALEQLDNNFPLDRSKEDHFAFEIRNKNQALMYITFMCLFLKFIVRNIFAR